MKMEVPVRMKLAQAGDIHQNNILYIIRVDDDQQPLGAIHKIQIRSLTTIKWLFEKSVDKKYAILLSPAGPFDIVSAGYEIDKDECYENVDNGQFSYGYKKDKSELYWLPTQEHFTIVKDGECVFQGFINSQWEFAVVMRQLDLLNG